MLSKWWPIHTRHVLPPVVDVPLTRGDQVRSVVFHCGLKSHALNFSAMLQQALPQVTVASGVMKTLIPPHPPQIKTPIHNNHPQLRKQTPENMEAAGSVSACKEASW